MIQAPFEEDKNENCRSIVGEKNPPSVTNTFHQLRYIGDLFELFWADNGENPRLTQTL